MMKIKNQRKTYRKKIDEKRCFFFIIINCAFNKIKLIHSIQ